MNQFENIKKENNFSVPKDYFEYLPVEIMERVQMGSKREKVSIFKLSFAIPSLAVLCGIIILLIFFLKNEIILSENEIELIINNPELYNMDEYKITEEYLSMNISDESLTNNETISEEEIKSYLEDNTDVTTIINEL